MRHESVINLRVPYQTRSIRPLEVWKHEDWCLKIYGITESGEYPRSSAVIAAKQAAANVLPQPANTEHRYGVGFLGVHDAVGGCYIFVDWWADENELFHRPFVAPAENPDAFVAMSEGSVACTWDLAVIAFERDAWVREVLDSPEGPNIVKYLDSFLSAEA